MWIETRGWTFQQGRSLVLAKLGFYHEPKMVEIEAGSFLMGSRDNDPQARMDEKPQQPVQIAKFEIGKYEVTFKEYDQFALATGCDLPNDSKWGRGRRPVINVSWHDAVAYAAWLSEKTGKQYRLPTEAEWEYACKAGKETIYCFEGDQGQMAHHAWYRENSQERTHPIGEMAPNRWGLHDMSGNVWEWTCSAYEWKYRGAELRCVSNLNSIGPWVLRGGSWSDEPLQLRSAARSGHGPVYWILSVGFRLAMTP